MGFKLAATFALLPFLIGQTVAADVFYQIPIDNVNVAPDGFHRDAIQAGSFPGQLIIANKGDVLHLNVTNNLVNPTMRRRQVIIYTPVCPGADAWTLSAHLSLTDPYHHKHWHGIFQDRTASEDGPSFVNQCPIAPGAFYQYNFPLFNQTGTYWFHSHLSTQYIDGERGTRQALQSHLLDGGLNFLADPDDPQKDLWDVDDPSTIITLADWYHTPAEALMAQFKLDGHEPVPDSGLINGVGRYVGGPAVPWAVVNVVAGLRYRLRIINISGFAAYTFSIDGHSFDVIETDGIATVPHTCSSFVIHAAQRYSVVLHANSVPGNYWIRAPMIAQGSSKTLDKTNVKAILRYAGAPIQDPLTSALVLSPAPLKGSGSVLQEYQLATLINPGAPGGSAPADHIIDLSFDAAGKGTWEINGIVYTPPSLPTLLNIINGGTVASDFTVGEHTFILVPDEVVELRIHGADHGITHPFHLHGHAFDIVQSAAGPVNYVNPPRRDVIGVESGGVIIRFRADNPGPWFLHCHIDWHLEAGLAVVFAESPGEIREGPKSNIITPQWLDLCPAYNALAPEFQ
ncbi:laccase [Mycena epipterygia]|nr:laccase [Mycena epipterygia]